MNVKNYIVAVDGGGSGCRLSAFDSDGTVCATASEGPASLSLGEAQAWQHIASGLAALRQTLKLPASWLPEHLCLGLAGSLQQQRRSRFLSLLPAELRVTLITDGHAQLLGATGGKSGACLAVGTGSVLHWQDEEQRLGIAGGWGYPTGDEGSGAWLGAQLINHYIWYKDGQLPEPPSRELLGQLEAHIGSEISDIQQWSTQTRSTVMATLAPMIVSSAEQGDLLADHLLNQGTLQCERLLARAPESLPIYLVGGLAPIYRPRFNASLARRFAEPCGSALDGLFTLSQTTHRSEA